MREAAEKRLGQIVAHGRLRPVVAGGDDPRVFRQLPAVVYDALKHDLEDHALRLLRRVRELVEEQHVHLAVLAELFQLHEPHGLDLADLVLGLVVNRLAVDALRVLVHELNVQRLRVDLPHAVALAVAGETVQEYRDVRLEVSADHVQLVVLLIPEGIGLSLLHLRHSQLL